MKKLNALWILAIFSMVLLACNREENLLDGVNIAVSDQQNIPAGRYAIPYEISNLDTLLQEGVTLTITGVDQDNQVIPIDDGHITIIEGHVYTITITLKHDTEITRTFTITAVDPTETLYHTVTFELNGGQGDFDPREVEGGTLLTLPTPPTKEGYIFSGWYLDAGFNTAFDSTTPIILSITLFAKWEQVTLTYTVSFETDGATESVPNQVVSQGDDIILPTVTKTSSTFIGWFTDASLTSPFNPETPTDSDLTLFAKWETVSVEHRVDYDLNGAPQAGASYVMISHGEKIPSAMIPIWTNHVFLGWAKDSQGDVMWQFHEDVVLEPIRLYAIWRHDKPVVHDTLDTNYFMLRTGGYEFNVNYPIFKDASTIHEGIVEMRQEITHSLRRVLFYNDFEDAGEVVEIGLVYHYDVQNFHINYEGATRLVLDSTEQTSQFKFLTEPLLGNKTYTLLFYIEFENMILVSFEHTLETPHLVESGQTHGLWHVLSGGYYLEEEKFNIMAEDGFLFRLYSHPNTTFSFFEFTTPGFKTIRTIDQATQEVYLHVIEVAIEPTPVPIFALQEMTSMRRMITLRYELAITKGTMPVFDSIGIVYTHQFPFVKSFIPHMSYAASLDVEPTRYTSIINVKTDGFEDVYVRAAMKVGEETLYGDQIHHYAFNEVKFEYELVKVITVEEQPRTEISFYTAFPWPPTTVTEVYSFTMDSYSVQKETFVGNIEFQVKGEHFVYDIESNTILNVYLQDLLSIIGVEHLGIYEGSVTIENPNFGRDWHFFIDGDDDYYSLPDRVTLTQKGFYTLYYRTHNGMVSISFEIR